MKKLPDNQIAFNQSTDGSVNIEVMFAEENIWLNQKRMAVYQRFSLINGKNNSLFFEKVFYTGI